MLYQDAHRTTPFARSFIPGTYAPVKRKSQHSTLHTFAYMAFSTAIQRAC
jgi:hypothetical protein